ncbi:MAG TPA: helix-turn-helix domain-containing protein, partial [bacterium]|nr:helix-turn-helix domain-containing protein [bacterium]
MAELKERFHVSLLTLPEAMIFPVSGLYEVLTAVDGLSRLDPALSARAPFEVDIVTMRGAGDVSRLPLGTPRCLDEVPRTDIVIIPVMTVEGGEWIPGRHPEAVNWLRTQHAGGAMLCSACSGVLLLAETGLLDGREATIHWAFGETFRTCFPNVRLQLDRVLVATGDREEFVMSGATATWQDLALYLIARCVSPAAAQAMAKYMLLQWHPEGQTPYAVFLPSTDHGDSVVLRLQEWLRDHHSVARPVEEMVRLSGIPERTFKRRFTQATGHAPIAYVQRLRIEEAKRRLERTDDSVDAISWAVGYEDPASFRRLFKRTTHLTPRAYRRMFALPDFARR